MLFVPELRYTSSMYIFLDKLPHSGIPENISLPLRETSNFPICPGVQSAKNLKYASLRLFFSVPLIWNVFLDSCVETSVISPVILMFCRLYSFVFQNVQPTEDTLNSKILSSCNCSFGISIGSTLTDATSFSNIVMPFNFIVSIPSLFVAENDNKILSVFSKLANLKLTILSCLSPTQFLI